MEMNQPQSPLRQSCGMPIRNPEDFGTYTNGVGANDYCKHCFQEGQFTKPPITMEQI